MSDFKFLVWIGFITMLCIAGAELGNGWLIFIAFLLVIWPPEDKCDDR